MSFIPILFMNHEYPCKGFWDWSITSYDVILDKIIEFKIYKQCHI
jgi:hypothetical protein